MDLHFMSLDTSEKNDDGPKKVFENIVSQLSYSRLKILVVKTLSLTRSDKQTLEEEVTWYN